MIRVHDLAHARGSDKGKTSNNVVVAHDHAASLRLERDLTARRVQAALAPLGAGPVVRHALPGLAALNFVIENALGGGVAARLRSTRRARRSARCC